MVGVSTTAILAAVVGASASSGAVISGFADVLVFVNRSSTSDPGPTMITTITTATTIIAEVESCFNRVARKTSSFSCIIAGRKPDCPTPTDQTRSLPFAFRSRPFQIIALSNNPTTSSAPNRRCNPAERRKSGLSSGPSALLKLSLTSRTATGTVAKTISVGQKIKSRATSPTIQRYTEMTKKEVLPVRDRTPEYRRHVAFPARRSSAMSRILLAWRIAAAIKPIAEPTRKTRPGDLIGEDVIRSHHHRQSHEEINRHLAKRDISKWFGPAV